MRAVHGRIERLVVQLEPADLGRVEIQLDFGDDGRVGAVITAERPETLDALQREAHGLERSLRDAGLRPDGGGLSFSLKRDQQQAGDGERRGSGGSRHAAATATAVAATGMPEALNLRLRLLDITA